MLNLKYVINTKNGSTFANKRNFVHHHRACSSIYCLLSYPSQSLSVYTLYIHILVVKGTSFSLWWNISLPGNKKKIKVYCEENDNLLQLFRTYIFILIPLPFYFLTKLVAQVKRQYITLRKFHFICLSW